MSAVLFCINSTNNSVITYGPVTNSLLTILQRTSVKVSTRALHGYVSLCGSLYVLVPNFWTLLSYFAVHPRTHSDQEPAETIPQTVENHCGANEISFIFMLWPIQFPKVWFGNLRFSLKGYFASKMVDAPWKGRFSSNGLKNISCFHRCLSWTDRQTLHLRKAKHIRFAPLGRVNWC